MNYIELFNVVLDQNTLNLLIIGVFSCAIIYIKYGRKQKTEKESKVIKPVTTLDDLKYTIGKAKDNISYTVVANICEGRNLLIKYSLIALFDSFCEQLDNFDLNKNHRCQVYANFLDNVYLTFNKKMVDDNVAKVVIDRFETYNIAHKATIMSQLRQAKKIDDSQLMLIFFTSLDASLEHYQASYIKTLTELNGQLTGFIYKNKTCH